MTQPQQNTSVGEWKEKGSCSGDSGGTAFMLDSKGDTKLLGATNYAATPDCRLGFTAYADMRKHRKWIAQESQIDLNTGSKTAVPTHAASTHSFSLCRRDPQSVSSRAYYRPIFNSQVSLKYDLSVVRLRSQKTYTLRSSRSEQTTLSYLFNSI